jgi:hypothetical protein
MRLVAFGTMLPAVADLVFGFKIGVVLRKHVSYFVYAAVRAHYKTLFCVKLEAFRTFEPFRRFIKRRAVFTSVAVHTMGRVVELGVDARYPAVRAVKTELQRA